MASTAMGVIKYRAGWKGQKCGKRPFARADRCAHGLLKSAGLLPRWDRHSTIILYFEDHIEWTYGHPVEFRE